MQIKEFLFASFLCNGKLFYYTFYKIMKINNWIVPQYTKNYKLLDDNYHLQRQAELEEAFREPAYWQILQRAEGRKINSGRILRLKNGNTPQNIYVKIKVENSVSLGVYPSKTYSFYDGLVKAGRARLEERSDGAYIALIKNEHPDIYGGVEKLTQKIAVAECLKRGLKDFKITGEAIDNSHAIHYLSGMRFKNFDTKTKAEAAKRMYGTADVNKIVRTIIKNTPKGSRYYTTMLGCVEMYMQKKVIKNIIKYLKRYPV